MASTALKELVAAGLARALEQPRPESTYRLQFHSEFTFRDARALVPYLSELGITHVYASPFLKARQGSKHGYDIVDHRFLNPEIGSPEDFDAWIASLHEHGLRLILDIVPNHMGIATNNNPWWEDVLENGPSSPFASYFDIAWNDTARPELQHKVLLPVLGEPYGQVLESGQLQLQFDGSKFLVGYGDRRFPIAPRSYAQVLGYRLDELIPRLGADSLDLAEYQSILTAIGHLPDRTETEPSRVTERHREKEIIKRRLGDLAERSTLVHDFIEENVTQFNGTPGAARSFDLLDELLTHQCYRLSFWRVALEEINYRRFFDVNDLAAICVERENVFQAAHELIFRLIAAGKVDGLRVDHPDGLYDPKQYFDRLQRHYLLTLTRAAFEANPSLKGRSTWADVVDEVTVEVESILATPSKHEPRWPLYVLAEKILGADEPLSRDWAIAGTSGYEFIRAVNGVFVDSTAEAELTRLFREFCADYAPFAEVLYRSKRLILNVSLAAELNMLSHQLYRLAQRDRRSRDFTLNGLRNALREIIACFPVYRSYVSTAGLASGDKSRIETAVSRAASRNPLMNASILHFVRDMLLLKYPAGASASDQAEQRHFAGKFQQVTSPVMAKGLEDTSFYIYNRLTSLNEVGGSPEWPKNGPDTFHRFNLDRQAHWPYSLAPLSTHDTKRSEDVRARIQVLSERPAEWSAAVHRWFGQNAQHRIEVHGNPVPDANEEYLLYQTLVGVWPVEREGLGPNFTERIQTYMVKALREAKVHSSWVNPNSAYDDAVREFVRRVLDPELGKNFLEDFSAFHQRIRLPGAINSLAQTVLKLTAPGVADTYQGTELLDFSLVDPDNRRPVDYERRRTLLHELRQQLASAGDKLAGFLRPLAEAAPDGRAKLYVTWRLLQLRKDYPGLFSVGEYQPLSASGDKAAHLFAFARQRAGTKALVAVPRLSTRLNPDADRAPLGEMAWGATQLPLKGLEAVPKWKNVFTASILTPKDGKLLAVELFTHFPVAVLLSDE